MSDTAAVDLHDEVTDAEVVEAWRKACSVPDVAGEPVTRALVPKWLMVRVLMILESHE
jgi:hypothetical protein